MGNRIELPECDFYYTEDNYCVHPEIGEPEPECRHCEVYTPRGGFDALAAAVAAAGFDLDTYAYQDESKGVIVEISTPDGENGAHGESTDKAQGHTLALLAAIRSYNERDEK